MLFRLIILVFLTMLSFSVTGQNSHLKICIQDKKTKEIIPNKEIVVIINDTLTKKLITNSDGLVILAPISGGRYKVVLKAEGYLTETFKNVGVDDARGRFFIAKLNTVKK